MNTLLLGRGAKAEDKELASEIMAGKMKNAWQAEDRPNQPDERPAILRPVRAIPKSPGWYENYDRTFRKKEREDGLRADVSK